MSRTFLPLEDTRASSINDLRDLKPQNKHVVTLEGESSPADGKSNVFWWDPSGDPSNADGKTIVASNLESSGVWRRVVTPAAQTSDEISEGSSNLFYTNERVDDRVNNLLTGGNGISLAYDDANDSLSISGSDVTTEEIQDDAWDVLTGTQSLINVSYDDANDEVDFTVEPSLSNYTNDAGYITDLSGFTTDDLVEGSTNLYFTEERVDDQVDSLLAAGNGITLTYNDAAGSLTITSSDVTTEEIQDDAWDVLTGTQSLINVSYDDANDEVDFSVESDLSSYDFSNVTTGDINEGSSNLYYTDSRVDSEVRRISPTNQATFDGGSSQYTIPHGLGEIPQSWHITPVSSDAANFSHVDADATNLIVNYSSNTPAGSQNVVLNWTAEKVI